jgi:hypothetical protein
MIEQLFGSKTRVKLLHLFLDNPDRSFYVREITRKIDEQINSVRRELSNLLEVGIIQSDSSNNKLYYQVNQASPHFDALKAMFAQPTQSADKGTESSSDQLKKRFVSLGSVTLVILTGSFVQHPELNTDILIVGNVQRRKLTDLIKDLEQEEAHSLSYSVLSEPDFRYRYEINDRFVSNILRHRHLVLIDSRNLFSTEQTEDSDNKKKERKK